MSCQARIRPPGGGRSPRWLVSMTLLTTAFGCAAQPLGCVLHAPAEVVVGSPVPLRFVVTNQGRKALRLLEWNTPFEGWFGAYVEVTRDGVVLPYKGPTVKRGEPSADEYLRFAAGQARQVTVELSLPFDLSQPGLYRVQPRLTLHDVGSAQVPSRTRAEHTAQALVCNGVELRVVQARGRPS